MSTSSRERNMVTLLHKGMGPRLFQYQSQPSPVYDTLDSTRSTLKSPRPPPKRIVVKCIEGQEANSMFTKRLQSRDPKYVGASSCCRKDKEPSKVLEISKGKGTRSSKSSLNHVPSYKQPRVFPPPNFMSRWNPRKMDRTYLDRMVVEDPWSLPPKQRAELQQKTGLRLKTISQHYQFKVASNLLYGKVALNAKCVCNVEFCDHCNKQHSTYRCPLHWQLLDPIEADCKTETMKICPFVKHPEDLELEQINDVSVYISEVVRRLKAGEITQVPNFPAKFKVPPTDYKMIVKDALAASNLPPESSSTMDIPKNVVTENTFTQTEPLSVDIDMRNNTMDNLGQTQRVEREEPMMLSVLKSMENLLPFKTYPVNLDKETQVEPFDIAGIQHFMDKLVRKFARMIVEQSFREISDELKQLECNQSLSHFHQEHFDQQRSFDFTLFKESFRSSAAQQELIIIEREAKQEAMAETLIGAIAFAQNFISKLPSGVMTRLRGAGTVVNQDLIGIQNVLVEELNDTVFQRLKNRRVATKLIDDIITKQFDTEVEVEAKPPLDYDPEPISPESDFVDSEFDPLPEKVSSSSGEEQVNSLEGKGGESSVRVVMKQKDLKEDDGDYGITPVGSKH